MPKIERRRTIVPLYQGHYEVELAELQNKTMAALRAEEDPTARRYGSRKASKTLAREFDRKVAEAEETAEQVTVWAIGYADYGPLADDHPPRSDVPAVEADEDAGIEAAPAQVFPADKVHGVNTKTFPPVLLRVSLVDPETARDLTLEEKISKGQAILDDLGDISNTHYRKLESAAWNVSTGDDSLPKYSLVSLLTQGNEPDSEQPETGE